MKKLVAGLFAVVLTCTAMAQTENKKAASMPASGEVKSNDQQQGARRDRMEQMMEKLNLTADQKEKMKAINEEFKKQREELKTQSLSDDQMKAKNREMMMARKEKINSILNEEQKKQWEEMRGQNGQRRGGNKEKED